MLSSACQRFRALAALSVDGEPAPSELDALALAQHLERCPACRSFTASVESFTREIRTTDLEVYRVHWSPVHGRRQVGGLIQRAVTVAAVASVAAFLGTNLDALEAPPEAPPALPALVIDATGADTARETQTFIRGLRDASLARTLGGPEHTEPDRPGIQVG